MEITSTSELLTHAPADTAPQSPPMSKPRSASVSLPAVDDDREPASPHYRAEPPIVPSTYHGRWRRMILATGVVVALAALGVGIHYYVPARGPEATDAVVDGHIVHVVPQVAGRVLQVLVTDNQPVQAGDLLVQIDPVDFIAKVDLSIAMAAEARGRLEQARWQLLAAEAAQALAEDKAVTARARGKSTADKRTSAQLIVAQVAAVAQVNLALAQIETAAAGVAAAEAALTQAGLHLTYTEVRAPRNGRVMTTNIETGEYVQVGKELLTLVADDLGGQTNFKADQLTTRPLAIVLEE